MPRRPGRRVDLSEPAILAARELAERAGLEAQFEVGNVYDTRPLSVVDASSLRASTE